MLSLTLLLTGCWYEAPVDTAVDYGETVTLSGELTVSDGPDPLGDGLVLVYEADNPPFPSGFGSPVDLNTVTASGWGGAATGLRSQPWSVSGLASGDYLVSALIDNDGDFSPFWSILAGATCGDQVGAYLDSLVTQSPAVVSVEAPETVDGLTVAVGPPLTVERPAFTLGTMSALDLTNGQQASLEALSLEPAATVLQFFNLDAVGIDHEMITVNSPTSSDCPSRFLITLSDADGDGVVDLRPEEQLAAVGLRDVWPKVYLIYAFDDAGNTPEAGHTYLMEAVVYANPWFEGEAAPYSAGATFTSTTLPLVFIPAGLHRYTDEAGQPAEELLSGPALPAGYWSILVVHQTGQTWVVPNQLGDAELATAQGWTVDLSQSIGSALPVR
ncbi:MAG: hypothetical protein H6739_41140 [Alphaproteobacteria bacterium]|nr:hypothetical protein [Alphaproteobacteria bacterium]